MSWLVQNLLRDSTKIHSEHNAEEDSYNDLLLIESKIKELYSDGVISDKELEVISFVSDGKPLTNSKKLIGKHRISTAKLFRKVCNKIAFYLGGYFTDDGYVTYMKNKYKLSDEDVEKMVQYMTDKYSYKIIRKQTNV